ncbi:hypothetical protein [Tessaracoccus coleopterorum]|uniref:hypothetical protein n=1 Tax=Tessaracoccus coleopterorum TaxID=2714950 RepID=UPI001E3B1621|nr:hypothetical protein [Tessaracoccus coleopterorum]
MDLRGTAQKTARLIGGTVLERTTARSLIDRLMATADRKPETQRLRARGWHIQMFEFRETHVIEGLAQRMRVASKAEDAFGPSTSASPTCWRPRGPTSTAWCSRRSSRPSRSARTTTSRHCS